MWVGGDGVLSDEADQLTLCVAGSQVPSFAMPKLRLVDDIDTQAGVGFRLLQQVFAAAVGGR